MIYGKMWCVVKPSVGIPLFLGACAVGSFAVHTMILNNTTWVKAFLNGNADKVASASASAAASAAPAAPAVKK
jgi:light-harvesting protein B-800-850 alpha chain